MAHLSLRRGEIYRTSQLHDMGLSQSALRRAVRTGRLHRLRQGVYGTEPHSPANEAAAHGGALACLSALKAAGIWLLAPPDRIHVQVSPGARVFGHDGCACIDHHASSTTGFGMVPVREALLQSRHCQSREAFFAAYESAWNKRLLSNADRAWIRARLPKSWRRLIRLARNTAESGLESILRLRLGAIGLELECQVSIAGVGRVDFLVRNLIIEVDGRLGHADPASRHKDLVRDANAAAAGYRVLRFDYALVIHDWPTVLAAVRGALGLI